MKKIQVYGPGCAKCSSLAEITQQAVYELQDNIPVQKVTDPMRFALDGVLVTPALVVDGKVLISGKVPSLETVKELLRQAKTRSVKEEECSCEKNEALASSSEDGKCRTGSCCTEQDPSALINLSQKESRSCCQEKQEPHFSKSAECCGTGGCCGGSKTGGAGWKKAVVWISAVLILLAVVKIINRQVSASGSDATEAVSLKNGVEVVYYEYGARCLTCIRMEKWTNEVIHEDFASQVKEGRLSFRAVPADSSAVEKYGLRTKSLIVKVWKNNKEARWMNLDRIWALCSDEMAFKVYVASSIRKQLDEVK